MAWKHTREFTVRSTRRRRPLPPSVSYNVRCDTSEDFLLHFIARESYVPLLRSWYSSPVNTVTHISDGFSLFALDTRKLKKIKIKIGGSHVWGFLERPWACLSKL